MSDEVSRRAREDELETRTPKSAATEAEGSGAWRTVESAPMDGTRIDVWAYWPEHDRSYRTTDAFWSVEHGEWQLGQFRRDQFLHPPTITHWMPPPAEPMVDGLGELGREIAARAPPIQRADIEAEMVLRSINLPMEDDNALRQLAFERRVSKSELIRVAVRQMLDAPDLRDALRAVLSEAEQAPCGDADPFIVAIQTIARGALSRAGGLSVMTKAGHTADCPHFAERFPWRCDCRTKAESRS